MDDSICDCCHRTIPEVNHIFYSKGDGYKSKYIVCDECAEGVVYFIVGPDETDYDNTTLDGEDLQRTDRSEVE